MTDVISLLPHLEAGSLRGFMCSVFPKWHSESMQKFMSSLQISQKFCSSLFHNNNNTPHLIYIPVHSLQTPALEIKDN